MNQPTITELLQSFDHLPVSEQRTFVYEILRRIPNLEAPPLDDDALTALADERFQELDRYEAEQIDKDVP